MIARTNERRSATKAQRGRTARKARVLLIDNYDSFTFNLVQRLGELGARVDVVRNDAITVEQLLRDPPERLVISPGPCTPNEAGVSVAAVRALCGLPAQLDARPGASRPRRRSGALAPSPQRKTEDGRRKTGLSRPVPILGVCLGHQAIGQAFGARIVRAPAPVHGKAEEIVHDGEGLFEGAPAPLFAGRYHSLVVEASSLPDEIVITAMNRAGIVMALRHRTLPVFGVQFHPESILTPDGQLLLENFLAVRP